MRIDYGALLEMAFLTLETFSRRDCGLILAGVRSLPHERYVGDVLQRLQQNQLIVRHGRGKTARFSITAQGRRRAGVFDPAFHWNKPWDGTWRVFTYDVPESRRRDRYRLWEALRARKLGLLQRSVWVWPHDVKRLLQEVLEAEGIPECFCGFGATSVFLCTNAEIVRAAWDFEEIDRRHAMYLNHSVANVKSLRAARSLTKLAHIARIERQAYQHAFSLDPLLPRALLPKAYRGFAVQERRGHNRATLARCLRELTD